MKQRQDYHHPIFGIKPCTQLKGLSGQCHVPMRMHNPLGKTGGARRIYDLHQIFISYRRHRLPERHASKKRLKRHRIRTAVRIVFDATDPAQGIGVCFDFPADGKPLSINHQSHRVRVRNHMTGLFNFELRVHRNHHGSDFGQTEPQEKKLRHIGQHQRDLVAGADTQRNQCVGRLIDLFVKGLVRQGPVLKIEKGFIRMAFQSLVEKIP